jgi:hypothetical protein
MTDVVVLPGGRFGPAAGLLAYAVAVAERRGGMVIRHDWTPPVPDPFQPAAESWVAGEVMSVLDLIEVTPLLIGKSLGSTAAAVAADQGLAAVWLTPLLTMPWVVAALSRCSAPFLLVGGTADDLWDGAAARRLSAHVCEVDGADHGMMVATGPLADSVTALGTVLEAIDTFLDAIGWQPEASRSTD